MPGPATSSSSTPAGGRGPAGRTSDVPFAATVSHGKQHASRSATSSPEPGRDGLWRSTAIVWTDRGRERILPASTVIRRLTTSLKQGAVMSDLSRRDLLKGAALAG